MKSLKKIFIFKKTKTEIYNYWQKIILFFIQSKHLLRLNKYKFLLIKFIAVIFWQFFSI